MHVVTDPQLDEATEKNFAAMMTKAGNIINQLKKTSSDVIELMRQLKTPVSEYGRGVIEDQLKHEFRVALKGNVPAGLMTPFASLFAQCAVDDVQFDVAKHGRSIVIYFLCTTVKAMNNLHKMIKSRFMDTVFAEVINLLTPTPTTVRVFVRDEDFNLAPSVLSSAQGLLFVRFLN